jgi:thymidylate synthase
MMHVSDIRQYFISELKSERFTIDKTGQQTIEMIGASFVADETAIFGSPSEEYIDAELKWYKSMSSNINDIYGTERPAPVAWKYAADQHGNINSNYGLLIYSKKYFQQFESTVRELLSNKDTRRATMVYTRPSIWVEYNECGKSDFICTNAVTYYIRDNRLHSVVQMRSNDAWAGYRNDWAWQRHVMFEIVEDYNRSTACSADHISIGNIVWQVQNLHVYSKNFYLVDAYEKGHVSITKPEYARLYPNSPYSK